ncbi:MAG: nucleotidyltransferase domain-containing protein [Cyanobacteria bacterium J06621_3]
MPFPTPLLDAQLAKEKSENEQIRQQLLQQALSWLTDNAQQYGVQSGYIFGSVTMPNRFTQHSDIDLAVETHKSGDICGLMGGLSMLLLRDIDMVPLDQCHFAEKIRATGLAWTVTE